MSATPPPLGPALLAVTAGGVVGALARWGLTDLAHGVSTAVVLVTLAINLVGSAALAALPALGAVRRHPVLAVALGPGLLGGFTTLSAASEQTRTLLADDRLLAGGAYALGSLAVCAFAVVVVGRLVGPPPGAAADLRGGTDR